MKRMLIVGMLAGCQAAPVALHAGRDSGADADVGVDAGADAGAVAGAGAGDVRSLPPAPLLREELPSVSTLATLARAEHPRRARGFRVRSGGLHEARSLRRPLRRARAAARSARPRTYRWSAFRLGAAEYETQLCASAELVLRPHPMDFVYYCEAEALRAVPADAFDVQEPRPNEENEALHALAAQIDALLRERPGLRLFTLRAGWADAVGAAEHGVVLVDTATDEALWIYAETHWSA